MPAHLRLTACYLALASRCAFLLPLIRPDAFRQVFTTRLERPVKTNPTGAPSNIRFILRDSTRVSVMVFEISSTILFIFGSLRLSRASFMSLSGSLFLCEYRLVKLFVFFVFSSSLTAGFIRWHDLAPYIPIPLNSDFSKRVSNPNRAFDFTTQDLSRLVVFRIGELRDLFSGILFFYAIIRVWVYYPDSVVFARSSRWCYRLFSIFFLFYSIGGDGRFGDARLLVTGILFVELLLILFRSLFSLQKHELITDLFWLKQARYGTHNWWF